jgi:endo-1,4-beta-D-glucanase Y
MGVEGCAGPSRPRSLVGEHRQKLALTWEGYCRRFVQADGRVVRPRDGMDTVSEGQAYALLRAVWMDDQETFDRVYEWTEKHLSRQASRGDHLLAWHWGKRATEDWGVLDWTAASDADEDYALALLFAGRRWSRPSGGLPGYHAKARRVLSDILAKETRRGPDGRLYLIPGDWNEPRLILNPSYLAPAWYRIFAEATGDPRWIQLIDSSYHAVSAMALRLGEKSGVGLMPDWSILDADGNFVPASGMSDAHGWDAFRTAWRLALDWLWFKEGRARRYLTEQLFPFLQAEWSRNGGRIFATYLYDGKPLTRTESAATYAAYLSACLAAGSPLAGEILEKLRQAVRDDPGGAYFDVPDDYYLNNWASFGLLLGEGLAVNLW